MAWLWSVSATEWAAILATLAYLAPSYMAYIRYEWVRCIMWMAVAGVGFAYELTVLSNVTENRHTETGDQLAFSYNALLLWTVGSMALLTGVYSLWVYEVALDLSLAGLAYAFVAASTHSSFWPYFTMLGIGLGVAQVTKIIPFCHASHVRGRGLFKRMPTTHEELAVVGTVITVIGVACAHGAKDSPAQSHHGRMLRCFGALGWGLGNALYIYTTSRPPPIHAHQPNMSDFLKQSYEFVVAARELVAVMSGDNSWTDPSQRSIATVKRKMESLAKQRAGVPAAASSSQKAPHKPTGEEMIGAMQLPPKRTNVTAGWGKPPKKRKTATGNGVPYYRPETGDE